MFFYQCIPPWLLLLIPGPCSWPLSVPPHSLASVIQNISASKHRHIFLDYSYIFSRNTSWTHDAMNAKGKISWADNFQSQIKIHSVSFTIINGRYNYIALCLMIFISLEISLSWKSDFQLIRFFFSLILVIAFFRYCYTLLKFSST